MKYYEVTFTLSPYSADAADILAAVASEAGFETFEETPTGTVGYVQQQLFDQAALDSAIADFPFPGTRITYTVAEAEDRDWNEQWEQEGFEPIEVSGTMADGSSRTLVIHDGRHLPPDIPLTADLSPLTSNHSPLTSIEIDAHLAFGTGTHETTRMICATLLAHLSSPNIRRSTFNVQRSMFNVQRSTFNVLDCGCGTGILGICALKLGATACTAYDIDEWSVDNTRHNAIINGVDDLLQVLHGDATLLDGMTDRFDLVMANINRNILLQDMERFVSVMLPGATLILSGFYVADCPMLEERAHSLGLTLQQTRHDGDWACMTLQKVKR